MKRNKSAYGLRVAGIAVMGVVISAVVSVAGAQEDSECMFCHGDATMKVTHEDGSVRSVYLDEEVYKTSVHANEGCISCHVDVEETPHPPDLEPVNCGNCHLELEAYEKSIHGQRLLNKDSDVNGCTDCHGVHDILKSTDPLSRTHPANLPATCGRCHSNPDLAKRHMISVVDPSQGYLKSIHAAEVKKGDLDAASCNSCHGAHEILPSFEPESRVYRRNIAETCGQCHKNEVEEYKKSIHGRAFAAGIKDAPTCNDCHGEHDISGPKSTSSNVNPRKLVTDTCTRCHDNETIMKKYGVATGRQASYMDSYHGMASVAGSVPVASCASCHNAHLVLPSSDPESSIARANLPGTCGKCHENAGPNFAVGAVHIMPLEPGQKLLGIVRLLYIIMICSVIGFMIVHNTLSMGRRAMAKFRQELGDRNTYRRFTTAMTVGHLVLTIAFILLALSGFALRYPETWWAQTIFPGEYGMALRGLIHRVAALALVGVAIINGAFLLFTQNGRRELRALLLGLRDIKDLLNNLAYMVGLRKERPKFDRYNYMEKFEYWGMWWGTLLMIVTGFCMWFVNIFLNLFPKLALDVIALVHFYEAWLAVLTIVVWHLYYMVFDPETYPMNWSWVTGKITMEDFKERHPLEYEREIENKEEEKSPSQDSGNTNE